jgi:hypothetical protein
MEGMRLFKTKGIEVEFAIPFKNYYLAILEEESKYRVIGYNTNNKNVYAITTLDYSEVDNINSQLMNVDNINSQLMNKIDPHREIMSMAMYNIDHNPIETLYE